MKRSFWLKSIFGSILLFALLLLAIWPIPSAFQAIPSCYHAGNPAESSQQTDVVAPPDLRMLLEQEMAEAVETDEQLEEEHAVEAEQVEQARIWLTDADPAERVSGAEQLSAYPTAQAEIYLLAALKEDADDEVRAAAASSLSAFKQADAKIFDGLLAALRDIDENVRFNAWSSLEILLNQPELSPKTVKKVQSALAKLVKQGRLVSETRDVIREYLQDQQGG
jgi:HEAT repeat protein